MKILPVSAFYDNYIWLIINEHEQSALCIDPGDAKPVLNFLAQENISLKAILLTHHHHDHIGGVEKILTAYPETAVYGPDDSRIPQLTHIIDDEDIVSLNSCQFQVLSTPGHTATHISLYEPHYGWLFCGDTLFSAGCGRVFDGTFEELHHSLQKLKALPDDTQVYCAHEYTQKNLQFAAIVEPHNLAIRTYAHQLLAKEKQCSLPSTIALEKQINPFLRTDTAEVQAYATMKGNKRNDSISVFRTIRTEKDTF
ncbi:hydroxyacylglutathione hydrolase [Legionella fairfieldensis]|uniref:hydroxyacylglutathione hydrolase n=1 Tax=Legionella fairfieldensis TaxID=45064 RepID=UPI000490C718|nr:hydroxyacylglutathione hydrolase [Legionella fairfieldensis]